MTSLFKAIDVSKYQGRIDWAKAKAAGVSAAWIRVGWAGYDGEIYWQNGSKGCDPDFHYNMQGAIAAGIPVGVYVFSYVKTPEIARKAVQNATKHVAQYKLAMPFAWDFEDSSQYAGYGKALNTAICRAALDEIKILGYCPMLYTYTNFANAYLNMADLSAYDLWQADYRGYMGAVNGYTGKPGAWQYTSGAVVNGVPGKVDVNEVYKDYPAIIAGTATNGPEASADTQPALFIMEALRVTQGRYDSYSHAGVNCVDIGGALTTGVQEPCFAPYDYEITRVREGKYGEMYIQSQKPVLFPNGIVDYQWMMLMHDDVFNFKAGHKGPQGEHFYDEGGMGNGNPKAYAAHVHFFVGRGKNPNAQVLLSNGNYTVAGAMNIEDCLWLKPDTAVLDTGGYAWKVWTGGQAAKSKLYWLDIGPASVGDKNYLVAESERLGLPVTVKEA